MDPQAIECALSAFERATGLTITVHAPSASLTLPRRVLHQLPICLLVKTHHQTACTAFDASACTRGRPPDAVTIKVCHAGLVEWVVSVSIGGASWRLFAGQRRAAPDLRPHAISPPMAGPWSSGVMRLEPVDQATADWIAELLAQCAARIAALDSVQHHQPSNRSAKIRRYIRIHHPQGVSLAGLARELGISPARAGHAVREACGMSFQELLTRQRLDSAHDMLQGTDLPIEQIARLSGFADPSRFYRVFSRVHGMPPAAWRRSRQARQP
ncbi:MAG: helix-turn-helix domain-containing protein [Planctomycetes bacterium]|nr:helix-turn-helix domain-containing protein [Planctomycetota bacterium]